MLDKYLEEIKKTSVLTEEQEAALAERICAGDSKAVEKLVTANLRFVVSMASKYQGRGIDLSDLVAEGNIALMRAAKRFEAGRGSRFVSYASPFVRKAMEQAIALQTGLYNVPSDERTPLERKRSRALSADAPLGGRANVSLLSVLENPDSPSADGMLGDQSFNEAVSEAMKELSDRERMVVMMFFGIGREKLTFAEIGMEMGLKRERVRQIRDKALRKISKHRNILR
ncbi:MAG: sigma-70 family RNA polymerase sigma factor [Prevotella sp.]|uniref:sigma-70 family RNA polymerase sigma factor n=1 Tax=Prevotella sp. PTAC TaxID=2736295 RepID=UPI001551F011|nr:sigma-70 family RNA polymerase sigma factor [Prevotella sp. PTAC]MCX4292731.1 sigma-70 family RNA polymerase sigma factor [Prevotella sp.]NPD53258.1 sigma-70 family RNA polymerase sigma factor [Prevotella sp. PTAC]